VRNPEQRYVGLTKLCPTYSQDSPKKVAPLGHRRRRDAEQELYLSYITNKLGTSGAVKTNAGPCSAKRDFLTWNSWRSTVERIRKEWSPSREQVQSAREVPQKVLQVSSPGLRSGSQTKKSHAAARVSPRKPEDEKAGAEMVMPGKPLCAQTW